METCVKPWKFGGLDVDRPWIALRQSCHIGTGGQEAAAGTDTNHIVRETP